MRVRPLFPPRLTFFTSSTNRALATIDRAFSGMLERAKLRPVLVSAYVSALERTADLSPMRGRLTRVANGTETQREGSASPSSFRVFLRTTPSAFLNGASAFPTSAPKTSAVKTVPISSVGGLSTIGSIAIRFDV